MVPPNDCAPKPFWPFASLFSAVSFWLYKNNPVEAARKNGGIKPTVNVQKVQQMQQAQQQSAMNADPTAQVLLKTQMAETQRKAQEFQTKIQSEVQKTQQDYQLKVAELQQKVAELQAKYSTQTNIDNQRNATNIAMAGKIDPAMEKLTGVSVEKQKRRANKMINTTTAESAAQQILAAVERNARRVLVGPDAKFLDKVVRLLGSWYQLLIMRQMRHMSGPNQH